MSLTCTTVVSKKSGTLHVLQHHLRCDTGSMATLLVFLLLVGLFFGTEPSVVKTEIRKWLQLIPHSGCNWYPTGVETDHQLPFSDVFLGGITAYLSLEWKMTSACPNIQPTNWPVGDLSSIHTGIPEFPSPDRWCHYGGERNKPTNQPTNSKSSGTHPPGATGCHVQDVWCGVRGHFGGGSPVNLVGLETR